MKKRGIDSRIDYSKIVQRLEGEELSNFGELNEFEEIELEQSKKTWKLVNEMQQNTSFNTNKAWNNLHSRLIDDHLLVAPNKGDKIRKLSFSLAIAASIILFFGLSIGYLIHHQNNSSRFVQIINTDNDHKQVTLPDGSTAFLNLNAQISYPVSFNNDSVRGINLKGEAFFEVMPNKNQPFVIHVDQSSIRVLGTSFNVKSIDDQNNIEVIVKTGVVQFCDCSQPDNHLILTKGERGVLFDGKMEKSINSNINFLGYIDQKLIFKAAPLKQVISDINEAYHSQIEFGDPDLNQLTITTTFDGLTFDELLKSISLTFDLRVEKQDKKVILVKN